MSGTITMTGEEYDALSAEAEALRKRARTAERQAAQALRTLKGLEKVARVVDANSDEVCGENNRMRQEVDALRVALHGIASVNPAERGIEWAKSYASDGLKGSGSELYARWLDTFKEAEALRDQNRDLRIEADGWFSRVNGVEAKLYALRAALEEARGLLAQLRGMINCTAENDADKMPVWISTKHPVIEQIDAFLTATDLGLKVK